MQVSDVLAQLTQQDDLVAAAQALGYSVRLRDCVGGGQGAACLQNLRHSFLILSPSAHSNSSLQHTEEIVIDPSFRENFIIAHPSPRYCAVLDVVPVVFIGTLSSVQPLVAVLCAEMAMAFKEAGSVMPPWRSLRSMMTKWMPRKSLDLALPACGAAAVPTTHMAAVPAARHPSTGPGALQAAFPRGGDSAAACRAARDSNTRLLRQACHAADADHSSLAPSSNASGIQSDSSNCSSSSGSVAHARILTSDAASVGCESAAASPLAPAASGVGPVEGLRKQAAGHTSSKATVGRASVLRPVSAAQQVVKCFEPLTRVVGGFGFCATPL